MTDVARPREHNANPLEAVIDKSKTGFLFFSLILSNDSPRAVIVNRGALARIPNERNDGKCTVCRPVKQMLSVRLGRDYPTLLLIQPIRLSQETLEYRLYRENCILRLSPQTNHRLGRLDKIF